MMNSSVDKNYDLKWDYGGHVITQLMSDVFLIWKGSTFIKSMHTLELAKEYIDANVESAANKY